MDIPQIPTNQTFESRACAQQHCQDWARASGYALVVRSCKRRMVQNARNGNIYWVQLACDRGDKLRGGQAATNRIRQGSTSARIGCPFKLCLVNNNNASNWVIQVKNAEHNHPPSTDIRQHAVHRRNERTANPGLTDIVRANQIAGITARQTWNALQRTEWTNQTLSDVHNAYYRVRQEGNAGARPIQAMMRGLGADYHFDYFTDGDHCLIGLAFFHRDTTEYLTRRFPYALVIDITYKTNRFGLFLLNIVGLTATHNSFVAGQALLPSEDASHVGWALASYKRFALANEIALPSSVTSDRALSILNAVHAILPSSSRLVCQWHVTRAIAGHVTKYYTECARQDSTLLVDINCKIDRFLQSWRCIQHAQTEASFELELANLKQEYAAHPALIAYLSKEWLPYREMWADCWTNHIPHFGNRSSNRVEGVHHAIKRQFQSKNLDLQQLVEHLKIYAKAQVALATHRLNMNKQNRRVDQVTIPQFAAVHGIISHFAMSKVAGHRTSLIGQAPTTNQDASNQRQVRACTGVFSATWGMPCGHKLLVPTALSPSDFHSQWWLDIDASTDQLDEFLGLRDPPTRAPRQTKKDRRELMAVELAEAALAEMARYAALPGLPEEG